MAKEKREKDLLELLHRIAVGIDRIGAALTIEVSDELKHEMRGGAEISEKTQKILLTAEDLRSRALETLSRTYR